VQKACIFCLQAFSRNQEERLLRNLERGSLEARMEVFYRPAASGQDSGRVAKSALTKGWVRPYTAAKSCETGPRKYGPVKRK